MSLCNCIHKCRHHAKPKLHNWHCLVDLLSLLVTLVSTEFGLRDSDINNPSWYPSSLWCLLSLQCDMMTFIANYRWHFLFFLFLLLCKSQRRMYDVHGSSLAYFWLTSMFYRGIWLWVGLWVLTMFIALFLSNVDLLLISLYGISAGMDVVIDKCWC